MPLYHYTCGTCFHNQRAIRPVAKEHDLPTCTTCNKLMQRDPKPLTTQVTEVLDNGVMGRKLERLADAQRLYKERSEIDPLAEK